MLSVFWGRGDELKKYFIDSSEYEMHIWEGYVSDPFVKDNPWTLRHAALLWEAGAAGLLVDGKVGGRKRACLLSGWSR